MAINPHTALRIFGILLGVFPIAVFAPVFLLGIFFRIGFRNWGSHPDGIAWVLGITALVAALVVLASPKTLIRIRHILLLLFFLGYVSACYCAYIIQSEGIYVFVALVPLLAFYAVAYHAIYSAT